MHLLKKLLLFLIITAVAVSSFTACKQNDEGKDKEKVVDNEKDKQNDKKIKYNVSFWLLDFGANRTKHMLKVVEKYNKTNTKGIKVNAQLVPPTANSSITTYDGKLLPAVVAGTPPDIICTGENHHILVAEDIIQEITPYVENDKTFSMDQFYPQKKEDCYYQGKLYSLPFQLDINGFMVWNEDMFKEAGLDPNVQPKNLQELDSMAEKMFKLNDKGVYDTVGYIPWTWLNSWCVERMFNAKMNNPDGSPNIVNDRMIECYQWVESYVKKYGYDKVNKSPNTIGTGKVGMQYCWIEEVNELRNKKVSFNWSVGPFPKAYPDAEPLWLGGYFLSLTKGSKVPEAAVDFMKYYCGEPGADTIMNSYLDEYGELTITLPNKVVTEKYVSKMPDKYKILVTEILPQMIINRKEKLTVPNTYGKHIDEFRKNVWNSKGEVRAMLTDLQKKMDAEWKDWQSRQSSTSSDQKKQ